MCRTAVCIALSLAPSGIRRRRSSSRSSRRATRAGRSCPSYAAHHVDEVLIVDPAKHTVHWLALADGEYREVERSTLIDLGPVELAEQIDWP